MGRTWIDDTLAMIAQARVLNVEVPTTDGSGGRMRGGQKCAQRGAEDVASMDNRLNRLPEGTKAMVAWLHGGYLMPARKLGSKQHSAPLSVAGSG
jgi:hypothetical protein